jgi:hypothetical protein
MFTNNYIEFQKARFTAKSNSSYATLKRADGATAKAYVGGLFVSDIGYWMTKAKCKAINAENTYTMLSNDIEQGVYFGAGSTPANRGDYKLESPITSGLSITNPAAAVWTNEGNGKYSISSDFIVRNTTTSEINIYEVGVFTPVGTQQNSAPDKSTSVSYVLMERTVLAEPITIPSGEPRLVTYKITFNQTVE